MKFGLLFMILILGWLGFSVVKWWDQEENRIFYTEEDYRLGRDTRMGVRIGSVDWFLLGIPHFLFITLSVLLYGLPSIPALALDLALPIGVYFALLLLLLPLLRRFLRSRTCGALWLFPQIACLTMIYMAWRESAFAPWFLIYLPKRLWQIFAGLWVAGFLLVLGYYGIQHLRFSRQIRKNSYPASAELQAILDHTALHSGWNRPLPLRISPEIKAPLSVGLLLKNLAVYLPKQTYTAAEYDLIFRHEIRHMLRRDNKAKLEWALIRALFWFNPLVWIAARRAFEDMELSCDEFVLKGASQERRKAYAELLLDTVGDSRGFSTCLSARASTLRYRLKCVVDPVKKYSGGLVLAVALVLLMLTCDKVAFVTEKGTLGQFIPLEDSLLTDISRHVYSASWFEFYMEGFDHQKLYEDDERSVLLHNREEVLSYLAALPVTGMPTRLHREELEVPGDQVEFWLRQGNTQWGFTLNSQYAKITVDGESRLYRVDSAIDWELLLSNLNFEEPGPEYSSPELTYWFDRYHTKEDPLHARSFTRKTIRSSHTTIPDYEPYDVWWDVDEFNHLDLSKNPHVTLNFSYVPKNYTVTVTDREGDLLKEIDGKEIDHYRVELLPAEAKYTVCGLFEGALATYETEFSFIVRPKK